MIEFLKFGASWVLPPGIFFVLFLFIAYCCKKRKQTRLAIAITFVTFIFYLASTSYVASMLIGRLEDAYDPPKHLPNTSAGNNSGTAVQRGITVLLAIIILLTTIHRIILVPILPIPEAVAM